MKKIRFLALFLTFIIVASALTSCHSKTFRYAVDTDNAESEIYTQNSKGDIGFVNDGGYTYDEPMAEAPMEEPKVEDSYHFTSDTNTSVVVGRKIIYSSSFSVETKEYDTSVEKLKSLVDEMGAWFENSNAYGTKENANRHSYYTIRVPVANYNAFLARRETIGVITSSSENNRDVTEQYTDIEARLASATLREERVLKILENADRLDDVLALERELSDIRYEIESYTGSLRKYDSQVEYATLSVNIMEVAVFTPPTPRALTFSERISKAFSEGFKSAKDTFEDFIVSITYNFISVIIFLVIIIVVLIIVKVQVKKYKKKKLPAQDSEKPEDTDVK